MTAAVRNLPNMTARMDRIAQQQREANIAAEGQPVNVYTDPRVADEIARYDNYTTAKTVLRSPDWYSADAVHAALDFVHEYENAVPARPDETPLDVLKRQGVRPVLAYAIIAVAVVYGGLLAYFGLLAWVAL